MLAGPLSKRKKWRHLANLPENLELFKKVGGFASSLALGSWGKRIQADSRFRRLRYLIHRHPILSTLERRGSRYRLHSSAEKGTNQHTAILYIVALEGHTYRQQLHNYCQLSLKNSAKGLKVDVLRLTPYS